ncbi:MAG: DUF2784 domain-containing protein [Nitrospirota bacterium]
MIYKILADIVVLIHFCWILFLFFGAIWGVKHKMVRVVHLGGLAFAIMMQLFGWYCPLTHLEVWLRMKHAPSLAYTGSFIIYYAEKLIYLDVTPTVIFIATLILCGFNIWMYLGKRKKRCQ